MHYDLAIIGGGVAGLAVALESNRSGATCILLEQSLEPSYASVRNQGWLHSGALYAYYGSMDLASDCLRSSTELQSIASQSGRNLIGVDKGVAFFDTAEQAAALVDRSNTAGIEARLLGDSDLSDVGKALMDGPYHNHAVEIPDKSISNFEFLQHLSDLASGSGTRFMVLENAMTGLKVERSPESWVLTAGLDTIHARHVVIAAGVQGPSLAQRLVNSHIPHVTKNCYVMAFPDLKTDRLYISPNPQTGNMNIAPFSGGTTVNCGMHDVEGLSIDSLEVDRAIIRRVHESIRVNWPSLLRDKLRVATYVCQKLDIVDLDVRDKRNCFTREIAEDLYIYYPGKLTLALSGARALSHKLFGRPGETRTVDRLKTSPTLSYRHPSNLDAYLNLPEVWAL